eukprot:CAMPEP_0194036824 /NCGR_PEP_ID=MMETSP0009_2-20130614/9189_1 /TAXON_ID=210454 /ORGANISM="Grammatophora oceanica, Strain CCMP 410" /LENGTH=147 /DNA_ID=CAMNT_0038678743 /DNA_START=130 /DNA_END=573 /DNA_ORIENTATION=+
MTSQFTLTLLSLAVLLLSAHGMVHHQPKAPTITNLASAQPPSAMLGRRQALQKLFGSSLALIAVAAPASQALDMDAFASGQLESDQKNCDPKRDPKCIPKLTADEALCKYGQSGNARSEACKKVRAAGGDLPSAKPQGKSLGGAYAM